MENTKLMENYLKAIPVSIDENGIYPAPAAMEKEEGATTLYSMACGGQEIIERALSLSREPDTVEVIVALDCLSNPGQFELDSFLTIFHIAHGRKTRVGIIEYSYNEGDPIVKDVDWQNDFFISHYEPLCEEMDKAIGGDNDI